jgi:hypothetical protein
MQFPQPILTAQVNKESDSKFRSRGFCCSVEHARRTNEMPSSDNASHTWQFYSSYNRVHDTRYTQKIVATFFASCLRFCVFVFALFRLLTHLI